MVLDIRETVGGAVGAVCCSYSGNPFDVIKVRLQTQSAMYLGPIDCFRKIWRHEGILAFWKGVTPALSSGFIENAVLFSANGAIKRLYTIILGDKHDPNKTIGVIESAIVGGLSGVCSSTAITPAEMIKCRLQINADKAGASPLSIIRQVLKNHGVTGMFRGLSATIARDVPFNFFFFGGYEGFSSLILRSKSSLLCEPAGFGNELKLSPVGIYLSGGCAGACAWSFVFPVDCIKSTMQTSEGEISFVSVMKKIYETKGIRGFYRGWSSAVVRAFPANAGLFLGYELTMRQLRVVQI